jgi:hypothetical protein
MKSSIDAGGTAEPDEAYVGHPQRRKVAAAARALWPPDGLVPTVIDPAGRDHRIRMWLLKNDVMREELPSSRTIRRHFEPASRTRA